MASYLTVQQYQSLSAMPAAWITDVQTKWPGWLETQLEHESARMAASLRKRYGDQYGVDADVPLIIKGWLAKILDVVVLLKRGVNATDQQYLEYKERATEAVKELTSTGDAQNGLLELPAAPAAGGGSAVTQGGPRSYSEQSPYVWMDGQAEVGHQEDRQRGGSRT